MVLSMGFDIFIPAVHRSQIYDKHYYRVLQEQLLEQRHYDTPGVYVTVHSKGLRTSNFHDVFSAGHKAHKIKNNRNHRVLIDVEHFDFVDEETGRWCFLASHSLKESFNLIVLCYTVEKFYLAIPYLFEEFYV